MHLVRAAEVKKAIEWIMCNLDGHYATDSVAAAAETAQENDGQGVSVPPILPHKNALRIPSPQGKTNDASSPSNTTRTFR